MGLTPDAGRRSIPVHEFDHTLFGWVTYVRRSGLDLELDALRPGGHGGGLWQSTYAATNYREYWAEGVQVLVQP